MRIRIQTGSRWTAYIVRAVSCPVSVRELKYLRTVDMNGIVHPCTHPEGKPAPETEEEMMVEVFKYTERVVNMARPRKLLMMAIGELGVISVT